MIHTRWGNHVQKILAVARDEIGTPVFVKALRDDNETRWYPIYELRADDGIHEILEACEGMPQEAHA